VNASLVNKKTVAFGNLFTAKKDEYQASGTWEASPGIVEAVLLKNQ
jgi:hypothetical protein